jgi:hypothetical protein
MIRLSTSFSFALAAAIAAGTAFVSVTPAEARKGKDVYVQDYKFKKPMHGYSGHSGAYYCDYQRLPVRKCSYAGGVEKCKIVGWTLRQMCQ